MVALLLLPPLLLLLPILGDVPPPEHRDDEAEHDERPERDHEHQRTLVGVQLPEMGERDQREEREEREGGHVGVILAHPVRTTGP